MKIVIAPDSFKESLSAAEAAEAIAVGMRRLGRVRCVPMADGGEGTLDALIDGSKGKRFWARVSGPRGHAVRAAYGILGDGKTGVVEMAQASGLALLSPRQRNPLLATSRGTGELIQRLIKKGIRKILLCLGGSATVDGGLGALEALGLRFLDARGRPIGSGARGLLSLAEIDKSKAPKIDVTVAADVTHRLHDAVLYAEQKGAKDLALIEDALGHLAEHLYLIAGRDVSQLPGSGAAGAMAAGFAACMGAEIRSGFDCVAEALKLEKQIQGADLVITGEGGINHQTPHGKTPAGVAALARRHKKPVIALAGSIDEGAEDLFDASFSLVRKPATLDDCLTHAKAWLTELSINLAETLKLGKKL